MPLPAEHATELDRDDVERAMRRRLIRVVAVFFAIQGIIVAIISIKARYAERRRTVQRPASFPSRDFEMVHLAHSGDDVRLYMCGEELLRDLLSAIDEATDEILFETFIWCNDTAGRAVRDALARAADRGVRVCVLWDWLLSDRSIVDGFFPDNIESYPFKRVTVGPEMVRPRNLLRDHRKITVIDQRVSFVGGYNIGDEYLRWRDTHLRIDGPSTLEVANAFNDFWNQHVPSFAARLANVEGRDWSPQVLVHRNDPSLAIFPIRGMYLEAIDRASKRVWITNAYFVPDRAFRAALCEAARRGADVRILLPSRSNHPLTDVLAHGMFEELLAAGVRIFLYRDFMVHAKTAVIDDMWTTVGTANLDRWSMLGNYEVNLEVRGEPLARQMMEMFELDLQHADEIHLDGWRKRPRHWKIGEWFMKSLAPVM